MAYIPIEDRLHQIYEDLKAGKNVEPVSVRTLLAWLGASRRGYWVVSGLRIRLEMAALKTVPDFDGVHIDSNVKFVIETPLKQEAMHNFIAPAKDEPDRGQIPQLPALITGANAEPAFRIGRLESSNKKPLSVTPDCTLREAATLMLRHNYSQLPVMSNERDVKGIVSWETIGSRLALNRQFATVREGMKPHHEVGSNESLFKVINQIVEHSYVLVRGEDRSITGIVTTTDLSLQFQQLSEPFLLLSEIENHVRLIIDGKFTAEELTQTKDVSDPDRTINTVADLTFGEYIRLLENPANWEKTGLAVDRVIFVKELDQVRRIRNDVMHFDPDGITEEDHRLLQHFVQFMHDLRTIAS